MTYVRVCNSNREKICFLGFRVFDSRTKECNKTSNLKIFMWAGVHSGCVCHLQHIHSESAVSGTYYVSAPKGSGALVFTDPRGLLPPFGGRHLHQPKAGEVILFPSWLRHEVAPSCDVTENNPRVALSFNVVGDWSQTNDATSLFFDLRSSTMQPEEEEEPSNDELSQEGGRREL